MTPPSQEIPQQQPLFHHPGIDLHQALLTISVNISPPLNTVPPLPSLHLFQTNVPPPLMSDPALKQIGGGHFLNFRQLALIQLLLIMGPVFEKRHYPIT